MRSPRLLLASTLLVGASLLVSACGGSDSEGGAGPDTTAADRTTTSVEGGEGAQGGDDQPLTTEVELTGSFCDKARQMTGIIEEMFNASTADQTEAAALAESKRFFAIITASLESLDESAPAEIKPDITYLKELFVRENAKAQKAKTIDAYSDIAGATFSMDTAEYNEHNDNVDAYFEDTCGIGAATTTTTTGG